MKLLYQVSEIMGQNFCRFSLVLLGLVAWADAAEKPNVVFFFTDDQGTLDLNSYGAKDLETPHLDRLADSGVRFTQAYAHTVCCPSRAALLTGRHPQRGGVQNWLQGDGNGSDDRLDNMKASEFTIAEALQSAGYDTALFGKWHLGAKKGHRPLDQGFDRFFGHLSGFIDNYRHCFLHGKGYHDLYDDDQEIFREGEYFPDMMLSEALEYLDERGENPFFMMMAFNLPHYPEQPMGKFAEAYGDLPMPRQAYARVVSTVDEMVGQIVSKLESKGLLEDTIIIMMSDNGHSTEDNSGIRVEDNVSGYPKGHYYSAHGGGGYTGKWIGNKGTFLEGGVRVPALISYPKALPRGTVRNHIVTVMDWYPTILDLAGISKPNVPLDGKSMLPLIEDEAVESDHKILHFAWQQKWAVRQAEWKLISSIDAKTKESVLSLHRLTDDEPETKNYAPEKPGLVKRLESKHRAWMENVTR